MPDQNSSDSELMHAVKKEDTSALVFLIERWQQRLLNFIYRYVQNKSVAQDLAQETFVRIYQGCDNYDENRTFSTWMFTIASNLCRNHQRWVRRHAEVPMDDYQQPVETQSPAMRVGLAERQLHIANAVGSLPHPLRIAVLLYYFEDLSYQEIADITGCSTRGIESRLYRARKLLAARLFPSKALNSGASSLRESKRLPV